MQRETKRGQILSFTLKDNYQASLKTIKLTINMTFTRPLDNSAQLKVNFLIFQAKHMLWVLKRTD